MTGQLEIRATFTDTGRLTYEIRTDLEPPEGFDFVQATAMIGAMF